MSADQTYNFDTSMLENKKLKIIIIGAEGDVGRCVCEQISKYHEIIRVGRSSGDIKADIGDRRSIEAMFSKTGKVDAVVTAAGAVRYHAVDEFPEDEFMVGISSKFMGQVKVVLSGIEYMNDGGSFTLTSGITNRDPVAQGASSSATNGAIEGFVFGAAVDMPRGIRINAVSPGLLDVSTERFRAFFPGFEPIPSSRVGLAYVKSVEGVVTGQVFPVF